MSSTTPFWHAKTLYLIASLLMFCVFATTVNSAATDAQLLQSRMKQLGEQGNLELQDELINSRNFLPEFYRQRDYQLVWTANMGNARALSQRILASHREGLVPSDYHAGEIQRMLTESTAARLSDVQQVDLDIILTEALARYAYHLWFGKVNPERLDADWNGT